VSGEEYSKLPDWVKEELEKLEFVQWDRFTHWTEPDQAVWRIYGWIDRKDSHEDFVHLEFIQNFDSEENSHDVYFLGTSSSEYSEKIHETLYGEVQGHVDCRRVENHAEGLENVIEIDTTRE